MSRIKFIAFVFITGLSALCGAQETHDVKIGESLYSVSKKYSISIQELVNLNPEAKRGLRSGMSIIIPSNTELQDTIPYQLHKVRPLESFYSIKSKYDVSRDDLIKMNPNLSEGFRAGTKIKIPLIQKEITKTVETTSHELFIPEIKKARKTKFSNKESYDIAFLLPLYLNKNDTIEAYQDVDEVSEIFKKTHYALDFFSGAKIAIDTLNNAGMAMNIYVYDTENDPHATFDIATRYNLGEMDLVIGPFYSKNFKIAAEMLSRKKTPIVAPLSRKEDLLENTPNAFQVIPTQERQVKYLSKFISDGYSKDCITVVRKENESSEEQAKWMLSSLDLDSTNYREIVIKEAVVDSIYHEIDSMAESNVFLIPSTEKDFVTDLLTKLNATRDSTLIVFGMPEWYDFEGLDYHYLMNLNVHLPNSGFISYQDSLSQYFIENYQNQTRSAPNERFAFAGFDISYYFLNALNTHGQVKTDMFIEPMQLLNMNFDFNYERKKRNGSRNKSVQIIKYVNHKVVPIEE
jgi:LysM repeat protein